MQFWRSRNEFGALTISSTDAASKTGKRLVGKITGLRAADGSKREIAGQFGFIDSSSQVPDYE
jgi:hypothetical protein